MNFDDRVNLSQLLGFVNTLISSTKGVDQELYFFTLEKEMNILGTNEKQNSLIRRFFPKGKILIKFLKNKSLMWKIG